MANGSTDRLCIVAGVGPGLGRALCRAFAAAGYHVAMLARNAESLGAIAEEIARAGGSAFAEPADLTDFAATRAAIERAIARGGSPAALVYNASVWNETPFLEFAPEAFRRDLDLMITGALVASQAVAPAMRAAGGGEVIFTGGGLALAPQHGGPVPSLAVGKAGLRALALCSAAELRSAGIRLQTITIAGAIAPGTPFDPDRIAETFLARLAAPAEDETVETVFRGADHDGAPSA